VKRVIKAQKQIRVQRLIRSQRQEIYKDRELKSQMIWLLSPTSLYSNHLTSTLLPQK